MSELLGIVLLIGLGAGIALGLEALTLAYTNRQIRVQLAKSRRQGRHVRKFKS